MNSLIGIKNQLVNKGIQHLHVSKQATKISEIRIKGAIFCDPPLTLTVTFDILTRRAKERSPDVQSSCLFPGSHHLHIGHAYRLLHCW